MKKPIQYAAIILAVSAWLGLCGSAPASELLSNPSFHILLNNEMAAPSRGSFDFDTKLFKINYSEEIDLATIDERVSKSLQSELKRKGLKRSTENPDVLVSYAVAMDASISGSDFNKAYADEFPISVPEPEPGQDVDYHQGTLIVDFVDSATRKLLWRGAIMADISMDVSEREKDQRVRHAVQILLSQFPKPHTAE